MRARPYKTAEGRVEGAVLSFLDVDELKRSLEHVAESKKLGDALNEIHIAINSTFEFDEIMRRVMERAGRDPRVPDGRHPPCSWLPLDSPARPGSTQGAGGHRL